MRDGWEEISLGQLTDNTRPICYGVLKPGPQVDGGVPLVKITDMDRRVLGPEGMQRISKELDDEFRRSRLSGGEVLLSIQGTVGRVAIAGSSLKGANISRTIAVIDPDDRLLNLYLVYVLEKIATQGEFDSTGSTRESLNISTIRNMKIWCPPIAEQRRTVDLISSVDSYIEALQQQLESAKRSRSALLHELLTAGGKDWVKTTLGDVCEFVNGDRGKNYPSAKFRQSHGIPFINAGHLDNGVVNFDSMDFISEDVFKKLGSGKIQSGDTLFCLRGSVGKFANVEDLEKGAIASSLVIIRPKSDITKDFLMHYLDSEMCSSEIKQSLTGAVQPNLSANNLKNFKISLPNIESQIEIGELLGEFKVSISSMGVLIESTKNLRAGLLSDLLSGKHEIPSSYDKVMGAA